jgi:hypothetical protein
MYDNSGAVVVGSLAVVGSFWDDDGSGGGTSAGMHFVTEFLAFSVGMGALLSVGVVAVVLGLALMATAQRTG